MPVTTRRSQFYRAVLVRPWWVLMAFLWTVFANLTVVRDNFLSSEMQQKWNTLKILREVPRIPWYGYVIGLLLIALCVVLEGSFAEIRKRESDHNKTHASWLSEIAKNQKPSLVGEVMEAVTGPAQGECLPEILSGGPSYFIPDESVIRLLVKAWNAVQMPDVAVKEYRLRLISNGYEYSGTSNDNRAWKIHILSTQVTAIHDISRNALRPLKYLCPQEDWLGFHVTGPEIPDRSPCDITVTLIDAAGGEHEINGSLLIDRKHIKGVRD